MANDPGQVSGRGWIKWAAGGATALWIAVGLYRGTHADAAPPEPSGPEGSARCALRSVSGGKPVECVLIAGQPADDVWERITAYKHAGVLFDSWLWRYRLDEVTSEPDGVSHLKGAIEMWFRSFPIDVRIKEKQTGNARSATWDAPSRDLAANRGGWRLTPVGPTKTEVRYSLELSVQGAPDFLVRGLMLDHLGGIVESIVRTPASNG